MQVDDSLATRGGKEEGAVFLVVHEEVLGEDCRAERVLEDIERLFEVRIAVGVVHAELVAGEVILGRDVKEAIGGKEFTERERIHVNFVSSAAEFSGDIL